MRSLTYSLLLRVFRRAEILFSLLVNSVGHNLANYKLLCYADDMKLFIQIDSPNDYVKLHSNDYVKLQSDMNRFNTWFQALGMILNLDNCHVRTYRRFHNPIFNIYHLTFNIYTGSFNISHVNCVTVSYNKSFCG